MINNIKAFLFDMDGVIYNSMPYHAVAWQKAMAENGMQMSQEDAYRFEGMRGVETINVIAQEQMGRTLPQDEVERIYARKSGLFAEHPFPEKIADTDTLMRELKRRGIEVVVVTGSGQRNVLNRICNDYKGLVSKRLMVTSFDVQHGKPEPDPYLMGMQKVHATPDECIVVENAPLGIKAGKAAGCFTIGINTGPLPDRMLADAGADIVVHTMKEIIELLPCE